MIILSYFSIREQCQILIGSRQECTLTLEVEFAASGRNLASVTPDFWDVIKIKCPIAAANIRNVWHHGDLKSVKKD
jgi:hypothetical protein